MSVQQQIQPTKQILNDEDENDVKTALMTSLLALCSIGVGTGYFVGKSVRIIDFFGMHISARSNI